MKAIVAAFVIFFSFALTGTSVTTEHYAQKEATVIICTGKYSKRYHNSICRGMKACKGETVKVTLSKAKEKGLIPCGYCYK